MSAHTWPVAHLGRLLVVMAIAAVGTVAVGSIAAFHSESPDVGMEEIYILRSIREHHDTTANGCAAATTGFDPLPADAERYFSFWAVRTQADGRVVDAKSARVAELRGCIGGTPDRARQNFYAEIRMGALSFSGRGECVALLMDFPENGLIPVRCHLVLRDLPAPFVGGLLTTNTIVSRAGFGGDTDPAGYTQASIATIRPWKGKVPAN